MHLLLLNQGNYNTRSLIFSLVNPINIFPFVPNIPAYRKKNPFLNFAISNPFSFSVITMHVPFFKPYFLLSSIGIVNRPFVVMVVTVIGMSFPRLLYASYVRNAFPPLQLPLIARSLYVV